MEQTAKGPKNRWIALLFISISLLVIGLDNTVLNVALPSIASDLGATMSELQWIVDAYILVFAALLLTMGAVGDRIGRKRALQFGLVWFGVGSVIAGLSNSTGMLIITRALIGVGGATIMPATLSIITATFVDKRERSQAIALWAATFGLSVGIGPTLGGWLIERFHWNAVFFVNVPIMLFALIGGYFFIQDSRDEHAPKPDIPGVILSIAGLFALVYGIIEAGMNSWTADNVLAAFAIAAVLLAAFGWWENRSPNAMLPVQFFRNMSFTGANMALVLIMFSMFGSLFFMSQFFQSVQGYSAFDAGVRILPMGLITMVAAALSARVSHRLGIKRTVAMGAFIAACGLFYLSQTATVDSPYGVLLGGLGILAIGLGSAMPSATDSVMGSVPVHKAGVGSAMNDTTRQIGGALGVAVLGTIMNNTYLSAVKVLGDIPLLQGLSVPGTGEPVLNIINNSIQGAHIVAQQIPIPMIADRITETTNQAFVSGMTDAMQVAAIIMLAASVVTLLILPSKIQPAAEAEPVPVISGELKLDPAASD
jgi:EmrB/QacA subfamily drug resistance transporter